MKKITKTTLKAFIRQAGSRLYVKEISDFNPQTDGITYLKQRWKKAEADNSCPSYTRGVCGVWVTSSTGYRVWENEEFIGIYWYNCCGSGIVAVRRLESDVRLFELLGI